MLALKKHNITYLYNQQEHWLITVVYKKIFTKKYFWHALCTYSNIIVNFFI